MVCLDITQRYYEKLQMLGVRTIKKYVYQQTYCIFFNIYLSYMSDFFSGSFFIALSSVFCSGFGLLLAHCFRLKCSTVNMCGITCVRDIQLENEGYEIELDHATTPRDIIPPPAVDNSRRNSHT
jgi:hypothetical protein